MMYRVHLSFALSGALNLSIATLAATGSFSGNPWHTDRSEKSTRPCEQSKHDFLVFPDAQLGAQVAKPRCIRCSQDAKETKAAQKEEPVQDLQSLLDPKHE